MAIVIDAYAFRAPGDLDEFTAALLDRLCMSLTPLHEMRRA